MDSIASIASSALTALTVQQNVTANNVANINTQGFKSSSVQNSENQSGGVSASVSQGTDSVDISQEALNMIANSNAFTANIKSLQVDDQLQQTLFSAFSTRA
jgi:flagellar hook protein FlgE